MRNILALVGAATVAFLAVGWYLGWYQVSSKPNQAGTQSVQVDINPDKITGDVKKGVEKGSEIVGSIREIRKDGPATKEAGPATNFFTPTSIEKDKGSSGGWKPIGNDPPKNSIDSFGSRVPRN
ncbi:MAG: hypothetical protein EXS09_01370 [Gemmataceae bacterium]|nr:hypothetical protein [Gemmataceae bacterium]